MHGDVQGSQEPRHVLIIGERGAQSTSRQLGEELELMGFNVSTQAGDGRAAERALQRSDLAAVVFLPDEEEGVRAWVRDDADEEPAEVELDVEGSRDTLALRTAELLRGRLMPGSSPRGDSADDERGPTSASTGTRLSISLGPSVIASSYATALIGLSGDVSWSIMERLAMGPYLLASLERGAWSAAPQHFSARQLEGGAKARFALLEPDAELQVDLVGRVGFRSLSLRAESGPPPERTTGFLRGPTIGLGAAAAYALSPWLSLGGDLTFVTGFPVWDAFTTNPDLGRGQQRRAEEAKPGPGPDFQWVTSLLLTARW